MAQMQCGVVLELTHICPSKFKLVFCFKTLMIFTKHSVYQKRCTIILELVYQTQFTSVLELAQIRLCCVDPGAETEDGDFKLDSHCTTSFPKDHRHHHHHFQHHHRHHHHHRFFHLHGVLDDPKLKKYRKIIQGSSQNDQEGSGKNQEGHMKQQIDRKLKIQIFDLSVQHFVVMICDHAAKSIFGHFQFHLRSPSYNAP